MFEIAKTVAFWIVFAVGIGGIGWLGFYVYDQLFTYAMSYFEIKRDLIEFMWNKRSKRQGAEANVRRRGRGIKTSVHSQLNRERPTRSYRLRPKH
ncbi:hypothetical protein V5G20_17915 [Brevibacillus borstelensis]|uniref:hypothetical protein n=1 Tax=Brevibacillus borstelensis TaxID=45462 RepID=UPI0030D0DF15